MVVRPTILDDFKTLVKQQGMSESAIIIKKNKGTAQRNQLERQHAELQIKSKRKLLLFSI